MVSWDIVWTLIIWFDFCLFLFFFFGKRSVYIPGDSNMHLTCFLKTEPPPQTARCSTTPGPGKGRGDRRAHY